jgi:hypothetical protein
MSLPNTLPVNSQDALVDVFGMSRHTLEGMG